MAKKPKKFIKQAIKHPGAFTAKAKSHDMTPAQFQKEVLSNPEKYDTTTKRQANLRKTLVSKKVGGKKKSK